MDQPADANSISTHKSTKKERYRQKSTPTKIRLSKSFEKKPKEEVTNFEKQIQVSDSLEALTIKKNSDVKSIEEPDTISHVLPLSSEVKTSSPPSHPPQTPPRPNLFLNSIVIAGEIALDTVILALRIVYWLGVSLFFLFLFKEEFRDIMGVDFLTWLLTEEDPELWI